MKDVRYFVVQRSHDQWFYTFCNEVLYFLTLSGGHNSQQGTALFYNQLQEQLQSAV